MNVLDRLSSSLNRRDELPNLALAKQIVAKKDRVAISTLVENLSNRNKRVRYDCIKVLYEIGEISPGLIAAYAKNFLALLQTTDNRLQWGAMTAISAITFEKPRQIFGSISQIIDSANKGSVITKDNAVSILIKLSSLRPYSDKAFSLLVEQLLLSPNNQLPMYAEKALTVVTKKNSPLFTRALMDRLKSFEPGAKRKRIEKVIKKLL